MNPQTVTVERRSYHYGRQGQVTLSHHDKREMLETEAVDWLSGQNVEISWPDGATEFLDMACTPMRATGSTPETDCFRNDTRLGYITLADGRRELVKKSRLPNVMYGYYRPLRVTEAEKETFEPLPASV
jgi:hypothetical protein